MKEDETVGKYFLRVEEMVNAMKALGETIDEPSLVKKILRSLPDMFNPKVSAIEELNDLKTMGFDQLLGTLTTYEMRIVKYIECYICHNYGHKSIDCRLREYEPDSKYPTENVKFWKKKESDKCGLVFSAQRKSNPWYIDSGCSKHMMRDKGKFLSLSESKSGNVTFGNDAPGKIKGKGMVSLSNGKGKAQDVLLVGQLKDNLLSVSQMCDRGCEVLFTSKDCKIKSVNSGQVVAKGIRTENNVYVLKEKGEEIHLSKHDERWLWHRRLVHLKFYHLFKLKNLEAIKDLPRISKPQDSMCKPCQVGKQNRTQFKFKSFTSIEKPLQLVHMDLCGPSRQEGTGKENYFMLIIDDYSRLTWVAFLKEKAEAFEKFKIFKALTETEIGKRLKVV
jgi:hypothetical protein